MSFWDLWGSLFLIRWKFMRSVRWKLIWRGVRHKFQYFPSSFPLLIALGFYRFSGYWRVGGALALLFGAWGISGFPFWVSVIALSESKHQESSISSVPTHSEKVEIEIFCWNSDGKGQTLSNRDWWASIMCKSYKSNYLEKLTAINITHQKLIYNVQPVCPTFLSGTCVNIIHLRHYIIILILMHFMLIDLI